MHSFKVLISLRCFDEQSFLKRSVSIKQKKIENPCEEEHSLRRTKLDVRKRIVATARDAADLSVTQENRLKKLLRPQVRVRQPTDVDTTRVLRVEVTEKKETEQ